MKTRLRLNLVSQLFALAAVATQASGQAVSVGGDAPEPASSEPVKAAPVVVKASSRPGEPGALASLVEAPQAGLDGTCLSEELAGLHLAGNGAFSFNDTLSMRGLSNTPIFGPAAVGVYLDEMPLGSPFTLPGDLSVLGSAELSPGPTHGSETGRAGPAGLLQLRSPLQEGAGGELSAGAGGDGARHWRARGGAAGGGGSVHAALSHFRRDGRLLNTTTGRRIDTVDTRSGLLRAGTGRGALSANFTLLAQELRNGEQALAPLQGPWNEAARSGAGLCEGRSLNAGLTLACETGWGRLSSTTSVNDWRLSPYLSVLSFGFAELANDVALRQRNWNQELRAVSRGSGALGWNAGLFVSDGDTRGAFSRAFGPMTFESSEYGLDTLQSAAFAGVEGKLGGGFGLSAGLRAEAVRTRLARTETVPAPARQGGLAEATALLPRLSLTWREESEARAHAGLALVSGFKPGGFSAFTGNPRLAGFGAERLTGLEFSGGRRFAGDRLRGLLRAHVYRVTGYQIERSFATGAAADDYLVVNAPRALSAGAEAGLEWHPLKGLLLRASASCTRAELREFRDPYTGDEYRGRRAPYVPGSEASVSADYRSESGWFAGVALTHAGRVYFTEGEESFFSQASRQLLSARAGLDWGRTTLMVHGRNLGDVRYWSSMSPGTGHGVAGAPLEWGTELRVRF